MEDKQIADLSKKCLEGLRTYVRKSCDHFHEGTECQLRRFDKWISDIGVLAGGRASLDYRLREAPRLADTLLRMLQLLKSQIERATRLETGCRNCTQDTAIATDDRRREMLDSIEDTVDWLHRFSFIVRTSGSKNTRDPLSLSRSTVNKEENDTIVALGEALRNLIEAEFNIGDKLQERLVDAVCLRRRHFLYRRSHQEKLARRIVEPGEKEESTTTEARSMEHATMDDREETHTSFANLNPQVSLQASAPSVRYSETVVTPVRDSDVGSVIRPPSPTLSTTSSWLDYTGEVIVPPAPDIGHEKEHACPYCCLTYEADIFTDDENWRRHIIKDLRPYLCVHEDCPFPDELFSSSIEWRDHLGKPHKTEWVCPVHASVSDSEIQGGSYKAPSGEMRERWVFEDEMQFQNHMERSHPGSYSARQISVLKRRSRRSVQAIVACPFCDINGYEYYEEKELEAMAIRFDLYKHIGEHLLTIALLSLPRRDPCNSNDDARTSGLDDNAKGKNTLRKVLEAHVDTAVGINIEAWLEQHNRVQQTGFEEEIFDPIAIGTEIPEPEIRRAPSPENPTTRSEEPAPDEIGSDGDRASLGLNLLYAPGDNTRVQADIVAVHGLGGHHLTTWRADDGCVWLRDLLPNSFPNARVFSFGYSSDIIYTEFSSGLLITAESLLSDIWHKLRLRESDQRNPNEQKRPLIFVGHSFGGIVIKQALLYAPFRRLYEEIVNRTASIIFLGTPHKQPALVGWAEYLRRIAILWPLAPFPASMISNITWGNFIPIDDEINCKELEEISTTFQHRTDDWDIPTHSFYELRITPEINQIVVGRETSILFSRNEKVEGLDANHNDICKIRQGSERLRSKVDYSEPSDAEFDRPGGWKCMKCRKDHRKCLYGGKQYAHGDTQYIRSWCSSGHICDACENIYKASATSDPRKAANVKRMCEEYGPGRFLASGEVWGPQCGRMEPNRIWEEVYMVHETSPATQRDRLHWNQLISCFNITMSEPDKELSSEKDTKDQQNQHSRISQSSATGEDDGPSKHRASAESNLKPDMKGLGDRAGNWTVLSQAEYRKILDWLTTTDQTSKQRGFYSKHHPGTGEWFLDSTEYQQWLRTPGQGLFCSGDPGSGKSIMTSLVVHDLSSKHGNNEDFAFVFTYFDFEERHRQSDVGHLIASWLKQLVEHRCRGGIQHSVPVDLISLYDLSVGTPARVPNTDELYKVLQCVVREYSQVFLVIDALDELDELLPHEYQYHQGTILSTLFDLRSQFQVNIFVASRAMRHIEGYVDGFVELHIRSREEDLQKYLGARIARCSNGVITNHSDEIQRGIIRSAEGSFLFAHLAFKAIESEYTVKRLKLALSNIPKSLQELYDLTLERINSQKSSVRELAIRVLSWMVFAKRQLRRTELLHALAVERNEMYFDEDNMPHMGACLKACMGLVDVEKESDIMRFYHRSAKEYLQIESVQREWFAQAQRDIVVDCITYLSYDDFKNGQCTSDKAFEARLKSYPLYDYASRYWAEHSRDVPWIEIKDLVLAFLKNEALVSGAVQAMRAKKSSGFGYSQRANNGMMGLHFASYHGLKVAVGDILDSGFDPNLEDNSTRRTPLSWAAECGRDAVHVARLLLHFGADPNAKDIRGSTPMAFAARHGREAIAKLLLEAGADVNFTNSFGQTPLLHASEYNHEAVVRLLINRGADVNSRDHYGRTPIMWASKNGNEDIFKLLLSNGADPDCVDNSGYSPLFLAVEGGHEKIRKQLLAQNIEEDFKGHQGRTRYPRD